MPPFLSDESKLTYIEQMHAKREAHLLCAPSTCLMELQDVDARIAELLRVRARLMESHRLVNV